MAEKIKVKLEKREKSPVVGKQTTYRDRSPARKIAEKIDNVDGIDKAAETDTQERGRSRTKEPTRDEEVVEDQSMIEMQKLMGFGGFGTTKNKKVEGANVYGAAKNKKSEYRQYMNREKGFNRSLSPTPEEKKQKKRHI